MDSDELKEKIAILYGKRRYGHSYQDPECRIESINFADKILSLLAPELDAAEEVSKFIRACSLNPFHGYATCARCFFRLTCAKKKIEVKDAE